MDDKEKELLAGFHHTISEQLNARLSESPKFFGLLVVVGTGYAYVLSKTELRSLIPLATKLSLAATLWASWYLAALGYAFRFLQTSQHRIEGALEWRRYSPPAGTRQGTLLNPLAWFWLLPGIYQAHAAGLVAFFIFVSFTGLYGSTRWAVAIVGVLLMGLANLWYLRKLECKITRK